MGSFSAATYIYICTYIIFLPIIPPPNIKVARPARAAGPIIKLYYQTTKIRPATGDGRSSTKVVLPENENPPR